MKDLCWWQRVHRQMCNQPTKKEAELQAIKESPCFLPRGGELQTAESGSARRMLRVLLLIPCPEERAPPEQAIFRALAVFQRFTSLCDNKFAGRFFSLILERMLGLLQAGVKVQDCSVGFWPIVQLPVLSSIYENPCDIRSTDTPLQVKTLSSG